MSSSLLKTLKIQELICKDIDEYIIKAIKLGTNKTLLNDMKNLVNINKKYIFQNNYAQEFDIILKEICSELM
jgi:predicted O-linked N-acetylglucosamine transferase (SPINDLY family)